MLKGFYQEQYANIQGPAPFNVIILIVYLCVESLIIKPRLVIAHRVHNVFQPHFVKALVRQQLHYLWGREREHRPWHDLRYWDAVPCCAIYIVRRTAKKALYGCRASGLSDGAVDKLAAVCRTEQRCSTSSLVVVSSALYGLSRTRFRWALMPCSKSHKCCTAYWSRSSSMENQSSDMELF